MTDISKLIEYGETILMALRATGDAQMPTDATMAQAALKYNTYPAYLEDEFSYSFGTIHEVTPGLYVSNDHVTKASDVSGLETLFGKCVARFVDEDLHFFSDEEEYSTPEKVRRAMTRHAQRLITLRATKEVAPKSVFGEIEHTLRVAGFAAGADCITEMLFTHQFSETRVSGNKQWKARKGHVTKPLVGGFSGSGAYERDPDGNMLSAGVVKEAGTTREGGRIQHWGVVCDWVGLFGPNRSLHLA